MAKPTVVQFEITGKDSAALRRFYASLFGWEMQQTGTPGYSRVLANTSGIPGAIGNSWDDRPGQVTFYVEVANLEEALADAEEFGGKIVGPRFGGQISDAVKRLTAGDWTWYEVLQAGIRFAFVADPEGHVVGLSQGLHRGLEQFESRHRPARGE
jgi:uncharacterized protein